MATARSIFTELQKQILSMQGLKRVSRNADIDAFLGPISNAFPDAAFPISGVHEFITSGPEATAATGGFLATLLSTLMRKDGVTIWVSSSRNIFPPALKQFGISPDKIVFVDLKNEKNLLWVMEEALKCKGLAAVVGEAAELSFNASRRLQLAVEESHVTGFVIRRNPRHLKMTACVTRWMIKPLMSELPDEMPGIGFPRWEVTLLKVRNGKPGTWPIIFENGKLIFTAKQAAMLSLLNKKAV